MSFFSAFFLSEGPELIFRIPSRFPVPVIGDLPSWFLFLGEGGRGEHAGTNKWRGSQNASSLFYSFIISNWPAIFFSTRNPKKVHAIYFNYELSANKAPTSGMCVVHVSPLSKLDYR
jgi:hypothetical protein